MIFISVFLLLYATLQVNALNFTFTLNASYKTSAGAYRSDGTLIRTIWKNRSFNAGTYTESWDEKDDYGNTVPAGTYQIKLTYHNVQYVWDGLVGNTSRDQSGYNCHKSLVFAHSMAVAGDKIYYAPWDNESNVAFLWFNPANAQVANPQNQNRQGGWIQHMDADANYLYQAYRSPWWSDNPKDAFVVARNLSDMSFKNFSSGQYLCNKVEPNGGCNTWDGHQWGSVIDRMTGSSSSDQVISTGLAVQKNGTYLFVSHGGVNQLHVLNKNTGQLVQNITMTNPGDIAAETNGNSIYIIVTENSSRVVKKYTVNSNGTLTATRTITGLSKPLAVGITPNDATVTIVDGGSSQQVKAFSNSTGASEWTLGQAGGYLNNPDVANDKFDFVQTEWSFIEFQADGSFWLCSAGDNRMIQFSSTRQYLQHIQYLPGTYIMTMDPQNPTRAFNQSLEFAIDYSKPLGGTNGSWKYVKNWGASLPANFRNRGASWATGFHSVQTLSNGRTYAVAEGMGAGNRIFELTANGSRDTGVRGEELRTGIQPDGSLRSLSRSNGTLYIYRKPLTGFDASGNPQYGAAQVMAQAPAPTGNEPFWSGSFPFYRIAQTSGGIVTTLREQGIGDPFHLGGIKVGGNAWHFKASKDITTSAAPPWNGDFPTIGSNSVLNQAHIHDAIGKNVVFAYHGESWGHGQANQFMHYLEDGTFIGQFGVPNYPTILDSRDGVSGNVSTISLVKAGSKTYLYTNDELNHGALPRWLLQGVDDIRTLTGQGSKGSSITLSGSAPIIVTGVSVAPTSQSVSVGSTIQLNATISPSNATNKSVTWSSSNTAVATVSNSGLVTGVAQGTATITVTTVDQGKTATATITVTSSPTPGNGLLGEYFNNTTLTGPAVLSRTDATVNFSWSGSPGTGLGVDKFSVRWSGEVLANYSETYTFYTNSDDGVRLWVNGVQLINNWTDHANTENSGTITLTAGTKYNIKMEYYENTGGAVARLSWSSASQTKQIVPQSQLFPATTTPPVEGTGLRGEYFNSMTIGGTVALSRIDSSIDFYWDGSPGAGVNGDAFSVRWTGQVLPKYSETYTFYTSSDDGVRLWVNNVLLIDNWTDHGVTENSNTITLTAGTKYAIRMEFYENWGAATAVLSWSSASQTKQVIPKAQLFPTTTSSARMATELETFKVEVYPNTATDFVVVENTPDNTVVQVVDLHGHIVLEKTINRSAVIELPEIPAGLYLVRVRKTSGEVIQTKRLIIEK